MKHWHALSHSFHFVRQEGRLATHPPFPASKSGSRLPIFESVYLGLFPVQIDAPYLFIMASITIPRDEYYTIHKKRCPIHNCNGSVARHWLNIFLFVAGNLHDNTVEPPLTTISAQRPPLHNGHFFLRTVHTLIDYEQPLVFLSQSSKTRETRKWPNAWRTARDERGTLVSRGSPFRHFRARALLSLNLK